VGDLANDLPRRGYDVASLSPAGVGLGRRLAPGVAGHEVKGFGRPWTPWASLRCLVRDVRLDVVHLHSLRAPLIGRVALRIPGLQSAVDEGTEPGRCHPAIVTTTHGWIPRRLPLNGLVGAFYRWATGLDDATLAVIRHTARFFGRLEGKVRVVPNGITPMTRLRP